MRAFRVALAAGLLFAAPAGLLAQTTQQPPIVNPIPRPVRPPHPVRPQPVPSRQPYNRLRTTYPVLIDGSSFVNGYIARPTPPAPRHTAKARPQNGQDVFETHSTDDAK